LNTNIHYEIQVAMPPVLDPSKSKVDGLAFLGLSLTRHSGSSAVGHPDSLTHQTAFDLNQVTDRDYEHVSSTNDDGWLVGGGEPGPPTSYKLASKDTAHVEVLRIGTYRPEWGGVAKADIVTALQEGVIFIPEITVVPTAVVANPDKPPELEIRFDMYGPSVPIEADILDVTKPLPINWQLRFLHNQLFKNFEFPSRFCPGAFHSTIVRKAEFRSAAAAQAYFQKCSVAVKDWQAAGPQPLVVPPQDKEKALANITQVQCSKEHLLKDAAAEEPTFSADCQSGLWLFTDRENISHQFLPNFLPPYDTAEKRTIIWEFLREEWDETTLQFVPVGTGGKKTVKDMLTEVWEYIISRDPYAVCVPNMQKGQVETEIKGEDDATKDEDIKKEVV
jgi:hypothetical protein